MVTPVQMFAQNRPVGQAVGQSDGHQAHADACQQKAGSGLNIQGAFHDGVKQQNWE